MHLLAPLWLLLALPLAAALIILYLLKLRRRDFVVPSVFLWEQALQDLQANVPLQKLRKNLLLLVQLLVLLFAVFALGRPAMQAVTQGGSSVVLVIDASASMQSGDVAPSRFAAAKAEGRKAIEALGPRDSMLLVAVGGGTRALTPFTTDKRALREALNRLRVTDGRADLRGALDLVAGMVQGRKEREPPRVVIVSDGAVPPVALPASFDLPIHFIKIGRRSENVGIVMMDVRRRISRRGGFEGLLSIKNFGNTARRFTLELTFEQTLLDARELTLGPGKQRTEVLSEFPEGVLAALKNADGVLTATIALDDDLAVDNAARVLLPKTDPLPVALVSAGGNLFLETALKLDSMVQVTRGGFLPPTLPPGAVVIADGVPLSAIPHGVSALIIGPRALSPAVPARGRGMATAPTVADWDRRHPVLEHVDLSGLYISRAMTLAPTGGARALIETAEGPIALVEEKPGRRVIYLGWEMHDSDFPLRVGFPIFIGNCVDWLSGGRARAEGLTVRTGQVVQLPAAAGETLTQPDGTTGPLGAGGFRAALAGVYTVKGKEGTRRFVANLADAGESNLLPHSLTFAGRAANVVSGPVRTEQELWRWVLLAALALLCLEWWVFHRRVG
ncbi:MAG TPA: VWA domain-containing protein [Armatimonadota bacterium]|nr:VWA domain-containing protein [Armatimonadota bacterium]HOS43046.1 VWA domain-containing protein [Armatimonadota bacterium]